MSSNLQYHIIYQCKNIAFILTVLFSTMLMGIISIVRAEAPDNSAAPTNIHIVYISNMPNVNGDNDMPSLAKVATFIAEERIKHPNLIFIHGGDSLAPSIVSSLDRGAHIIDILNSLGPDMMSISKREFSYGEDVLIMRSQEALFPFVSNNLNNLDTGTPYSFFEDGIILDIVGLKVGIIAATSSAAATRYSAEKTVFLDVIETTKKTTDRLRQAGAQVIIFLYDNKDVELQTLIDENYVDVIFETSFYEPGSIIPDDPRFLHHDQRTGYISTLDFVFDPNKDDKITMVNFEMVDISDKTPDPDTQALIDSYINPLNIMLDMKLGYFDTSFSYSRGQVRTKENAFANFIVDVMLAHTQADVAILNGGAVRGSHTFENGDEITRRHIQNALPFRNSVTTINVTGTELLNSIEYGLGCMEISSGCGTHLANMRVQYDNSKPQGERIISATIAGAPVELDKTYTLATTNYIARGGDGFTMFADKLQSSGASNNILLWEVVSNHIFQKQNISPRIDGRLKNINE